MTTRKSNWPALLNLFVEEKRNQPFAWGENDCCLFVCDWLTILTGEDPARFAGLRGTYRSALSACRILAPKGDAGRMFADYCAAKGWPEVRPIVAARGDVVAWATRHGIALGVCLGRYSAFAGLTGVEFCETNKAVQAWRIT